MPMYLIDKQTGCWNWAGPTCSDGRYGRVPGVRPILMAHRHHFQLQNGPIPRGMFVCHKCDNGLCVNPEHLFLGSPKDNMQDCLKKVDTKTFSKINKAKTTQTLSETWCVETSVLRMIAQRGLRIVKSNSSTA